MKNEDAVTTRVEEMTKRIPSIGFLELSIGAMALSAGLMIAGRKNWANFVGQWAPTFLVLGVYNKLVKTFSAPYDEEQRVKHGEHASAIKSADELRRQESMRPLS